MKAGRNRRQPSRSSRCVSWRRSSACCSPRPSTPWCGSFPARRLAQGNRQIVKNLVRFHPVVGSTTCLISIFHVLQNEDNPSISTRHWRLFVRKLSAQTEYSYTAAFYDLVSSMKHVVEPGRTLVDLLRTPRA